MDHNSTPLPRYGLHCTWTASSPDPVPHICHIPQHSCDIANKSQSVPSHSNHPCQFHKISKIPGTLVPCLNSDVIKPQPCPLSTPSVHGYACLHLPTHAHTFVQDMLYPTHPHAFVQGSESPPMPTFSSV